MAKTFVSRLNAIIRCIVLGGVIAILICTSCPSSAEQPPAQSSDLDLLLARKQYDKFEREFTARAARLTAEDRTYFEGVLANRINLADRSILLLQPLISGLLMSNPVHAEYALCTLADNYARNFRYGRAANTYLQAAFVAEANRAESTCDARHEAARWALLDGAPPQTIRSSGPFALSGSNDSLGLLRVPVNVGTYTGSWILDTGANLSVVSRSVADRLGLAVSTRTADAAASSGHSVPVRVAVIPQIQLGTALIRNVAVLVAEDSDLTFPSMNYRIEGCLGLPVLMALGEVSVVRACKGLCNVRFSRNVLFSQILVWLCSSLSAFAQSQQPMTLINFEGFSAATWPYYATPPVQTLSATISGGLVLLSGVWVEDQGNVYYTGAVGVCDGCLPTVTINFSQPVSNFSVLVLNGNYEAVPITLNDDQGGQQQVWLAPFGYFGEVKTVSLPENNIRQVTISGYGVCFAIDNVQFTPSSPVLLDPVDSGYLSGPQITTNTDRLSQGGVIVQGVAADGAAQAMVGVTQAVVRIPATTGESFNVTVLDEDGIQETVQNEGGLFPLGGSPQSAAPSMTVNAVETLNGPMAFLVYVSPSNFARSSQDYTAKTRAFSLQVVPVSPPGLTTTLSASLLRPPVVLVHGLWGDLNDWNKFTPVRNDPLGRFFDEAVDYTAPGRRNYSHKPNLYNSHNQRSHQRAGI